MSIGNTLRDIAEETKRKEPTQAEIDSYVSAWDGDITDEQARELLKADWRENEHR